MTTPMPNNKLGHEELANRFGFHKGTEVTGPKHQQVREMFLGVAVIVDDMVADPRAKALAVTALQEAAMWTNYGIALEAPLVME